MFVDEYYNTVTFGGAEVTLRDFARIGQLMLNGGVWNGREIVPDAWLTALSQPSPQNQSYGYLWWLKEEGNVMIAAGDGDRILIVMPEHDLVAVRLQRTASLPGTFTTTYFNDRGRMHGAALEILQRVVPTTGAGGN
jgi:CubicO group peptidase (beta-lactamase class C family)